MGYDVWKAIMRRYQEQANAEINAPVERVLDEPSVPVPHDTYHRILHRLRQRRGEAVMQETFDLLRGPRVGADALPTRQLEELSADLDAAHAVPVISCGVVGHAPDCECATL